MLALDDLLDAVGGQAMLPRDFRQVNTSPNRPHDVEVAC
jgi:hypothetical protein